MTLTDTATWKNLANLAAQLQSTHLAQALRAATPVAAPALTAATLYCDFGKQNVNQAAIAALLELADDAKLGEQRDSMFKGEPINISEQRPALHVALRGSGLDLPAAVTSAVSATRSRMEAMAAAISSGAWRGYTGKYITDIVHIGIGGSHLGPELAVEALAQFAVTQQRVHFVANVDAYDLHQALHGLNPETTLFIIVSKSWSTLETRVNANTARSWFLERSCDVSAIPQHFLAITTNTQQAADFGLPEENLLPMWDWVGGRYSIWSAVGLPLLITLGAQGFAEFLSGAKAMDQHFLEAEPAENGPMLAALFALWNTNFLGAGSHAVLAYDGRLEMLPDYLQQLEMESNGKSVTQDGQTVGHHTMPIVWGGAGTQGQHAYHQLLHQGTRAFSADFVLCARTPYGLKEHQDWLGANALAQSQAMAEGFSPAADEPHRAVAGNHASTTIVLPELSPFTLGALLAFYEHKTFCLGTLWRINPFDQWGVELGKKLALPIFDALKNDTAGETTDDNQAGGTPTNPQAFDISTRTLIEHIKSQQH